MSATLRHPGFVARTPAFDDVIGDGPQLRLLAEIDAHEGPVHFADENALYFTTVPQRRPNGSPHVAIKRVEVNAPERVEIVVADANAANGMAPSADGGLLVCEQGTQSEPARISRLDRATGKRETVVDGWRGRPFNSPNDVVEAGGGSIWFTDPSYGHLQGFRPEPVLGDFVYRHDPSSGETTVVADSFDKPNGLVFSPDERVLYVTDSGANQTPGSYHVNRPHHVRAFDVLDGRALGAERLLAVTTPGFPDG